MDGIPVVERRVAALGGAATRHSAASEAQQDTKVEPLRPEIARVKLE
jgi:hypothetical protein